jgi:NAD dependent epimerase/dehydratase family
MVGLGWDPGGRASDRHNPGAVSESIQRYCALQLRSVRITTRRLIPLVLDAASGKRLYVTVIGTDYPTPDGTAVRDYVHVCDLARTHVLALEYLLDEGDTIAVNLGTGRGASVRQVVDRCDVLPDAMWLPTTRLGGQGIRQHWWPTRKKPVKC